MKSDFLWVVLVISIATIISVTTFNPDVAADFQALWVAGEFYQAGAFDQIYPPDTEYFTSKPSPEWIAHIAAQGQTTPIYSYIYPPIWAALFAKLTTLTTFHTLSTIAGVINPILLGGMAFLAWRFCCLAGMKGIRAPVYVALVMIILMTTTLGTIGLFQNQVQILVSFLILLGLERERANAPIIGGFAMGLAAAIKLYPVFFAIFWLAQGKNRAAASFIIGGGAIGLLSIFISGWPLHEVFLEQVRVISNGVFLNKTNYALETSIANVFFQEQLVFSTSAASELDADALNGIQIGQLAMAKPAIWMILSQLVILLSAITLALVAYKTRDRNPLALWPFALTLVSLMSPLAWGYHFLPAASFAPAILAFLGFRVGLRTLAICFIPLAMGLLPTYEGLSNSMNVPQLVGFSCLATYCAVWAYLLAKDRHPVALTQQASAKDSAIPA
ncbi:glycosyltransferase family 87 protein [Falsihalocynthiibacter sp. BN13B15]|uniref:glycosyltransferase family 87 protein n=1 Tax=Falsihalocynthiibacter sp. BN13B15 TaxID=3240871 RepID=UPI003510611B